VKLLIALYHPFSLWTAPSWLSERLRADFPQIIVSQLAGPKYEGIDRELEDTDICIAWSIRAEQFRHAGKLKWIHSPAAAVHQLMFPELINSNVMVTNARDVHGPVVAEHALALVLALAKKLHTAMGAQHKHLWAQQQILDEVPTTTELNGAHVVLIGLGSIGREFTRRAQALGMQVTAVREHPEKGSDGADRVVSRDQLSKVLSDADFVVLAAPLTPGTKHILNAESLLAMKPTGYVINVSRGPLIEDKALIDALRAKRIAGAALDVFAEEPLQKDSPYWDLPNVLITPHTAAVTAKLWDRHYQQISANLRRFLAGEPLEGVVNKQLGY
jgi:phosphoglycerate dehydrogenase-like enzyme